MAKEIKELSRLPIEHQHQILEALCKKYHPIEIDDKVYLIPQKVNDLIDSLTEQLNDFYTLENIVGKEEN